MANKFIGNIADKRLESLGFKKIMDDEHIVCYERWNEQFKYLQKLDIIDKEDKPAIIMSYDPELCDQKNIGSTCVGLSRNEAIAAAMKIASKGWK